MKAVGAIFAFCLGLGVVVSIIEKVKGKKGWVEGHRAWFYERNVKRPLDFGLALMALIVLWPVMLILDIAVRGNMGTPVIFTQPRPGLKEKIFYIRKYRTMTNERDGSGNLLSDEKRLTKFGRKMRATSLDELPELVNIIQGDMSIVGPRPQLIRDMVFMSGEHRKRHDVRPGLTGLAQVSGRNAISWDEKLDWDLKYVEDVSFAGDVRILWLTVKKVFGAFRAKSADTAETDVALDYGDALLKAGKISKEKYSALKASVKDLIKENGGVSG